jgi:alkaline phosphatase
MGSLTGPVTDSAAASSAWGGGERVINQRLNVTPDGGEPEPILVTARRSGLRTGLVTTARMTHATPAGFLVNIDHRDKEDAIAAQYLERGADLFLGGGSKHFAAATRADGEDYFARFGQAGYTVVQDRDGLMGVKGNAGPLLGIFGADHLPYTIDHVNQPELLARVPTLAEMTRVALQRLGDGGHGFLLQVEAARVDHGAHDNDTPASLFDQLAFDDALAVAVAFRQQHPETVLIVTTDHGNANPALNGSGPAYRDSDERFARLQGARSSYQKLWNQLDDSMGSGQIKQKIHGASGIDLTDDQLKDVVRLLHGERWHPHKAQASPLVTFAALMANHTSVGWTGTTHTADYSPLLVQGGAAADLPQLLLNTELHHFIKSSI